MLPEQNTAVELTPIDNPLARPRPHPICQLIPSADEDELQDRRERGQPCHDHSGAQSKRKVKEKGEPELQEAVKRGRIGVQDAAKVADLLPEQQKGIAESPKPRRAAAEAAEAAKSAASRARTEPRSDTDQHAALRKAWKGANALRGLWDTADVKTKEWFIDTVLFDSDETGEPAGNSRPH